MSEIPCWFLVTINGWRLKGGILLYGTFLPIITQLSFLWRKEREGVDQRSFCGRAFLQARQLTEREEGSEDRAREEEESGM